MSPISIRSGIIVAPAAAGSTFTFAGSDTTNAAGVAFTSTTVNIGAATSDRFVIVAASDQNGTGMVSVTVNGVSLALDAQTTTQRGAYIWSGLVGAAGGAGPATIVATYGAGAGFTDRIIMVWTGRGMSHTAGAATTAADPGSLVTSINIAVTAGDFMVADVMPSAAPNFSTSTEAPTAVRSQLSATPVYTQTSPEWNKIIATNAAFALNTGANCAICAATYH